MTRSCCCNAIVGLPSRKDSSLLYPWSTLNMSVYSWSLEHTLLEDVDEHRVQHDIQHTRTTELPRSGICDSHDKHEHIAFGSQHLNAQVR